MQLEVECLKGYGTIKRLGCTAIEDNVEIPNELSSRLVQLSVELCTPLLQPGETPDPGDTSDTDTDIPHS